ncbi:hypothetical protein KC678_00195 [Candidatus Dojkabacteria bacterium]|uniref:Uncharacterized protein n=1 Tax=Candidatus Dojkabacteria bacterium TaxID=2099670 RepID=A0A955I9T7_9BACT|nr:hypothetical protein [Candidatus Dojkabacteria bacterium]
MDYCWVVSDKKMKGSGLKKGDLVLVTGTKVAPISKIDPYLQRIFVITVLVKDGEIRLPKSDNHYRAYLVDPRNLEKVDEDTQKWAEENLKKQYGNIPHYQI